MEEGRKGTLRIFITVGPLSSLRVVRYPHPSIHSNCKFVLRRIVTGGTRTMEVRQMEASIRRRLCWRGRLLLLHGL